MAEAKRTPYVAVRKRVSHLPSTHQSINALTHPPTRPPSAPTHPPTQCTYPPVLFTHLILFAHARNKPLDLVLGEPKLEHGVHDATHLKCVTEVVRREGRGGVKGAVCYGGGVPTRRRTRARMVAE